MNQRLPAILWLVAGVSAAGIATFLVEPIDLAIFIGGAVLAIGLGLLTLARPGAAWSQWSTILGVAWLIGFGAMTIRSLGLPIYELASVIWVLAWGLAAALVTYRRTTA